MSLRPRLAGAEFAFLSRPGATRRTPNRERRFFLGFHEYIMVRRPGTRWSILTNKIENLFWRSSFRLLHEGQIPRLDWN